MIATEQPTISEYQLLEVTHSVIGDLQTKRTV